MVIKEEDYLEHYGRLGMKWYQHKFGEEDGRAQYTQKIRDKQVKKAEFRTGLHIKAFGKASQIAEKAKNDKAAQTFDDIVKDLKYNLKQEVAAIKTESFEDFQREKHKVYANIGKKFVTKQLAGPIGKWGLTAYNIAAGNGMSGPEIRTKVRTGVTRLDIELRRV